MRQRENVGTWERANGVRDAYAFDVQEAGFVAGETRRIKGYANTWRVMRSGRIIHPAAIEKWLESKPDVELPLLAQHGMFVGGFATIGTVDKLKVVRNKGLYFEAALAEGTALADEAAKLVEQGVLKSISIGWMSKQSRYVRADDADLDPWLGKKMKEAGVDSAQAFLQVELLEISLVDVGDDAGAKLVAEFKQQLAAQVIDPLCAKIETLTETMDSMRTTGLGDEQIEKLAAAVAERIGKTDLDAQREQIVKQAVEAAMVAVNEVHKEFATGLENRLVEAVEAKQEDLYAGYHADDFEADADEPEESDATDGDADAPAGPEQESAKLKSLHQRLGKLSKN